MSEQETVFDFDPVGIAIKQYVDASKDEAERLERVDDLVARLQFHRRYVALSDAQKVLSHWQGLSLSERAALDAAGYAPSLAPDTAGQVYTFDQDGCRVRVDDPLDHRAEALLHPESYSTDAALRPLLADAMLPTVVSVLGPGEIRYQAMLRPLYGLFNIPQPLLFPRKSYTIMTQSEAKRIGDYHTSAIDILTKELNQEENLRTLVPQSELELFDVSRKGVEAALMPLRPHLEEVDPNLGKTWIQTLANVMRSIDKLEERSIKASMSKSGFSKKEMQSLRNTLLPRGRLQERVFPLTHFLSRCGFAFIDQILTAGELDDFSHHVLALENPDA